MRSPVLPRDRARPRGGRVARPCGHRTGRECRRGSFRTSTAWRSSTRPRTEYADATADPGELYAQVFTGEITGVAWEDDDDTDDTRVPLGRVVVGPNRICRASGRVVCGARLPLVPMGGVHRAFRELLEEGDIGLVDYIVILDRVELVPEARGHGLGLHVAARALLSWIGGGESLVVATAYPTGEDAKEEDHEGAEALARYWQRLGLQRVEGAVPAASHRRVVDAGRFLEQARGAVRLGVACIRVLKAGARSVESDSQPTVTGSPGDS